MQLQVNEKHEITGYATVGGFVGGIEAEASSLPESFEESFAPGKYLYENGRIVENPDYIPQHPPRSRRKELLWRSESPTWKKLWPWPSTEVRRYERHERNIENPLPGDRPTHGGRGRA